MLAIAFILIVQDVPHAMHPQTLKLLKEFVNEASEPGMSDRRGLTLLNRLNGKIEEANLSTVEQFATTKEADEIRWALIRLLIDRDRYESSARLLVQEMLECKGNEKDLRWKSQQLWKWWEHSFGQRLDYFEMVTKLTDGFLVQFDAGNDSTKQVVAFVHNKGNSQAKLSLADFKKAINYDKVKSKPSMKENQAKYLQEAAKLKTATLPSRLRFYFDYMEDTDGGISADARHHFEIVDSSDVLKMVKDHGNENLRQLLRDRLSKPSHCLDQYLFMLAAFENKDDISIYRSILSNPDQSGRLKEEALSQYIKLAPDQAVKYISDQYVSAKYDFVEWNRCRNGLALLKQAKSISDEKLCEVVLPSLKHDDFADLIIDDLRRWKLWKHTETILAMSKRKSLPKLLERSVLRYVYSCPQNQYPEAKVIVDRIRKEQPELHKDIEEALKLEEAK